MKKILIIIDSVLIVLMLLTLYFLVTMKSTITEASSMPIDTITSPVSSFTREEISKQKITLRADVMNVTKRNVERKETKYMSDSFTLPDTDQTVVFPSYPGYYNYKDIKEDYTNTGYFNYYKYMLLRQGLLSISECVKASQEGTLTQDNLYKHPAADDQNGPVLGTDNAVVKEITIDPTYKSYHTTGLYLPAGELIEVKVENLGEGENIKIVTGINWSLGYSTGADYFTTNDNLVKEGRFEEITLHSQWERLNNRLPIMGATFTYSENKTYYLGTPYGGIIHLDVKNTSSAVKLTISGAVETPHFILGTTTVEYFDEYLRDAPGVLSCLDVENGILVGNDKPFRTVDDIENIALLWHSFFAVNETYTGGPYQANNLVKFDVFVPAGAAVYLGNGVSCCPISWYAGCLNYQSLLRNGTWGVLHEIGHGNASAYGTIWGLGGTREGEVRNNAIVTLCYLKFLELGTYRSGEHGEFAHSYRTLYTYSDKVMAKEDFNDNGYFEALSVYVNIMHSFGPDMFFELLRTYQDNKQYISDKRADLIYRCSLTYEYDFRWYFNEMYKCNVSNDVFTSEQIAFFDALPRYVPIASYYGGGIDDIKTSGDLLIPLSEEYVFDFENNTYSPESFEITNVGDPLYGTLSLNDDGTYTYVCKELTNYDQFSYEVKQENGQTHSLDIYIRLLANTSKVTTYDEVGTRDINEAILLSSSLTPSSYSISQKAGISQYQSGNSLKVSEFIFLPKESKEYVFYLKGDDANAVFLSFDNQDYESYFQLNSYINSYNENNSFSVSLTKDQKVYFKIYNLNFGGTGHVTIGIKNTNGTIQDLTDFYNVDIDVDYFTSLPSPYIQKYMISNKGTLEDSLPNNKNEWKILTSPNHQNGNFYTVDIDGEIYQYEKADWLIDDDKSTLWHSVWSSGNRTPLPHEFIIDTNEIQSFNYFSVSTRARADSLIKKYSLYLSLDNETYTLISSGEELLYNNYLATIHFPETTGRYWKLVVDTTTGQNSGGYFTVINELDAGISSTVAKMVLPSSVTTTDGYSYSYNSDVIPNNYYMTNKQDEVISFSFKGQSLSIHSYKNKNFGKAIVYIDGIEQGTIDLNSTSVGKALVYYHEFNDNIEHFIEIKTCDNTLFNIEYLGLSSSSEIFVVETNVYPNITFYVVLSLFACLFIAIIIISLILKKQFNNRA